MPLPKAAQLRPHATYIKGVGATHYSLARTWQRPSYRIRRMQATSRCR